MTEYELLCNLTDAIHDCNHDRLYTPDVTINICTSMPDVYRLYAEHMEMPDGMLEQPTVWGSTKKAGCITLHLFGTVDRLTDRVVVDTSIVPNYAYLLKLPADADGTEAVAS